MAKILYADDEAAVERRSVYCPHARRLRRRTSSFSLIERRGRACQKWRV